MILFYFYSILRKTNFFDFTLSHVDGQKVLFSLGYVPPALLCFNSFIIA